jgi:hypothetical protein
MQYPQQPPLRPAPVAVPNSRFVVISCVRLATPIGSNRCESEVLASRLAQDWVRSDELPF